MKKKIYFFLFLIVPCCTSKKEVFISLLAADSCKYWDILSDKNLITNTGYTRYFDKKRNTYFLSTDIKTKKRSEIGGDAIYSDNTWSVVSDSLLKMNGLFYDVLKISEDTLILSYSKKFADTAIIDWIHLRDTITMIRSKYQCDCIYEK